MFPFTDQNEIVGHLTQMVGYYEPSTTLTQAQIAAGQTQTTAKQLASIAPKIIPGKTIRIGKVKFINYQITYFL